MFINHLNFRFDKRASQSKDANKIKNGKYILHKHNFAPPLKRMWCDTNYFWPKLQKNSSTVRRKCN